MKNSLKLIHYIYMANCFFLASTIYNYAPSISLFLQLYVDLEFPILFIACDKFNVTAFRNWLHIGHASHHNWKQFTSYITYCWIYKSCTILYICSPYIIIKIKTLLKWMLNIRWWWIMASFKSLWWSPMAVSFPSSTTESKIYWTTLMELRTREGTCICI